MHLNRRNLLRSAGGLASLSMLANPALAAILRQRPELILHNGNVLTMDGRQPQAEAVAIAGDRILAVGSDIDILDFAGAGTKKVDLGGKTVVPGFIDGHCHPAYSGRRHLRFIDCDLRSIAAIKDAVRRARSENAARRMGCRLQVRRHQDCGEALHHTRGPGRRRARTIPCTSSIAAAIRPT